jgi:glycosyltransferase involved in cell wall biosynthesis
MNVPMVSVIIPTFNSEEKLALCLQSIRNQTYPNIEVIVVDKYSSDNTVKIAKKFSARILLKNCERSAAKNYGATNANGLFVLFEDSDQELTSTVVEECVAACFSKGADAAIILEESIPKGFLSECRKMEKELHRGDAIFEIPRFFKRDVFQKLEGYDEDIAFGEDSDLYIRMEKAGFKTCRVQPKIMHYEGELSMKKIALKANYYGRSLPIFIRKNPYFLTKKHNPIQVIRLHNIRSLFREPVHLVGLAFIKIVEYEAYLTGIVIHFLSF